jgi:hypothetical protein
MAESRESGFTTKATAQLGRVPVLHLNNWEHVGVLRPAAHLDGRKRRYSFAQVVAVRMVSSLPPLWKRSFEPYRALIDHISARSDLTLTRTLEKLTLITDGRRVQELRGQAAVDPKALLAHAPVGLLIVVSVDELLAELQPEAREYLRANPPEDPSTPRLDIASAYAMHASGASIRQVATQLNQPYWRVYEALRRKSSAA